MKEKYRVLAVMTAAQVGFSIVQQAIGVLAPFFLAEFAISKAQLGSLFTAMFLGSAALTLVAGILTDRLGERRMVAISASLMSIALLGSIAVENFSWLVGWMFLFGVAYAASAPAGTRAILRWFDRDRGFAMGFRQTGVPLGGLAGALILPFVALHFGGYRGALFVAAILVALPAAVVVIFYRVPATQQPQARLHLRDIIRGLPALARDRRLLVVSATAICLVSIQQALNGFLTVTDVKVVGLSPATAAVAFAASQAAATFGRLFWGWVSDRFLGGERIGLLGVLSVLAAVAAFAVASLRADAAWLAIPVAILIGVGASGWNGIQVAALGEIAGPERAGSALGLALTIIFGVAGVAPLLFGALADRTSLTTAWYVWSLVALAGALPSLWLKWTERREQALHPH